MQFLDNIILRIAPYIDKFKILLIYSLPILILLILMISSRINSLKSPLFVFNRLKNNLKLNKNYTRSFSSSSSSLSSKIMPSSNPAYTFLREFQSPDFKVGGKIYQHIKTGAEVISMEAKDVNKVFLITFKTLPTNSHGIPHVLEHSVLCGSKSYPVKEPFSAMLKGSLNTFLNAFTYPDRTCYPVASSNQKDFHNLVNVYLDAVLFPRVIYDGQGENILKQEGWHYELFHKDEESKSKPLSEKTHGDYGKLTIQGVVYNEMKGVYSSPDSIINRKLNQKILGDHPIYSIDSGGDPEVIPNLSYEELSSFYKKFYHPSNSKVYFYGDDDLEERLVILDKYFSQFDKNDEVAQAGEKEKTIPFQPIKNIKDEDIIKIPYAIEASQPPLHSFSYGFLLNDKHLSMKDRFLIDVMDYLLFGTSTSTLKKYLTESGLANRVSGYNSNWSQQFIYYINLKGVKEENVEKIQNLYKEAFEHVLKTGFSKDATEAAIAKMEFRLREFSQNDYPKGLLFFLDMDTYSNYGLDPIESLYFEEILKEIKEEYKANPNLFLDLFNKLIVQNSHVVKAQLVPDKELNAIEDAKQKEKLENLKKSFTVEQLEEIAKDTLLLKEIQATPDSPEALATIPKLSLDDIPVECYIPPREIETANLISDEFVISPSDIHSEDLKKSNVMITKHDLPSQGIVYTNFILDCSLLNFEDLKYLQIFLRLLPEVGTEDHTPAEIINKIDRYTGGIQFSKLNISKRTNQSEEDISKVREQLKAKNISTDHLTNNELLHLFPPSADEMKLSIDIEAKCLASELNNMLDIINEIISKANLSNKARIIELLKESKSSKEQSVLTSGHSYANTNALSRFSLSGYINNLYSGLPSIKSTGDILEEAENNWEVLEKKLRAIREKIFFRTNANSNDYQGPVINITTDTQHLNESRDLILQKFYKNLPVKDISTTSENFIQQWNNNKDKYISKIDEIFTIPSKVNYVGFGGKIVQSNELDNSSYHVINNNAKNDYLWNSVRIQGGAYGAGLSLNLGLAGFYSYRDPHLSKTIENYKNITNYLEECSQNFKPDDILPSIIGVIGDVDKPLNSQGNGYKSLISFLTGRSDNNIQLSRKMILNTKNEDYADLGQKMKNLFNFSDANTGYLSAVASSQSVEEDLSNLKKILNREISIKSAIGEEK